MRLRAQIDELYGSDRDLASTLEDVARLTVRQCSAGPADAGAVSHDPKALRLLQDLRRQLHRAPTANDATTKPVTASA